MSFEINLSIPSDPKYLCLLRSTVENVLTCMDFSDTERSRTILAIDEAVTNIIRHSCECDPSIVVDVKFKCTDNELYVEARDFGDCGKDFDIKKLRIKDMKSVTPGGFGINIIKKVMDSIEYKSSTKEGNVLVMRKKIR